MVCPRCGEDRVTVSVINEVDMIKEKHSALWWIFVGWWWLPIKWLVFTLPAIIVKLFGGGRKKVVNTQKTVFACQNCGNTWSSQ